MKLFSITALLIALLVPVLSRIEDDDAEQKEIARRIEQFKVNDWDTHNDAVRYLATKGEVAIPALKKALKNENKDIREGAIWALSAMKPPTKDLIPLLFEMGKDPEPQVAEAAYTLLIRINPAPENLAAFLRETGRKDKSAKMRQIVLSSLVKLEVEDEDSILFFRELLKDKDKAVRSFAASLLGKIGPEAKIALNDLIATLKDRNTYGCPAVPTALHMVDPRQTNLAIDALIEIMMDKDSDAHAEAVSALGEIRSSDPKVVRVLIDMTKDKDWHTRIRAVSTLGEIGSPTPEVITTLIDMLKKRDEIGHVIGALGYLGPSAKDAIPELLKVLNENGTPHFETLNALWSIAPTNEQVLKAVMNYVSQDIKNKSNVSYFEIETVSRYGQIARSMLSVFQEKLNDKRRRVQVAAAVAIARVGGDVQPTVPVLIRCVSDEDQSEGGIMVGTQGLAANALARLGPQAKEAVSVLRQVLDKLQSKRDVVNSDIISVALALVKIDPEQSMDVALRALAKLTQADEPYSGAKEAAEALSKIGLKGVSILAKMLADERLGRRRAGADALGRIGPKASDALPGLYEAMKDQKPTVRCAIINACANIDLEKSQTFFLKAIDDQAWSVRYAALKALSKIKNPSDEVTASIKKMKNDKDVDVKELASSIATTMSK